MNSSWQCGHLRLRLPMVHLPDWRSGSKDAWQEGMTGRSNPYGPTWRSGKDRRNRQGANSRRKAQRVVWLTHLSQGFAGQDTRGERAGWGTGHEIGGEAGKLTHPTSVCCCGYIPYGSRAWRASDFHFSFVFVCCRLVSSGFALVGHYMDTTERVERRHSPTPSLHPTGDQGSQSASSVPARPVAGPSPGSTLGSRLGAST